MTSGPDGFAGIVLHESDPGVEQLNDPRESAKHDQRLNVAPRDRPQGEGRERQAPRVVWWCLSLTNESMTR